ncbi:MAG: hypothetical protein ACI9P3_002035 [Bradyrhizobium sp.]|jgi:hypothetical protein
MGSYLIENVDKILRSLPVRLFAPAQRQNRGWTRYCAPQITVGNRYGTALSPVGQTRYELPFMAFRINRVPVART